MAAKKRKKSAGPDSTSPNPYAPPPSDQARPGSPSVKRGRVMLGFVLALVALPSAGALVGLCESASRPDSLVSAVPALTCLGIEGWLMYTTWIGQAWARNMLGAMFVLGAVAGGYAALDGGSLKWGLGALFCACAGLLLLFSRDVRAYAEVEKFPARRE